MGSEEPPICESALTALHLAHLDCRTPADAAPLAALERIPALRDLELTSGFVIGAAEPFQKHLAFGPPDAALQVRRIRALHDHRTAAL